MAPSPARLLSLTGLIAFRYHKAAEPTEKFRRWPPTNGLVTTACAQASYRILKGESLRCITNIHFLYIYICMHAHVQTYIHTYICLHLLRRSFPIQSFFRSSIEGGRPGECGKRPDAESEFLKPHCFRRRRIVTPHRLTPNCPLTPNWVVTPNCLLMPHWVVTTNSEAAMGGDAELLTPH